MAQVIPIGQPANDPERSAIAYLRDHLPADYRVIPGDAPASDVVMSHISVNYDRSGFQEDINVVFPLARLRELQAAGEIGSISDFHYSFMGASQGHTLEAKARELAGLMKRDRVDAVLLTPV